MHLLANDEVLAFGLPSPAPNPFKTIAKEGIVTERPSKGQLFLSKQSTLYVTFGYFWFRHAEPVDRYLSLTYPFTVDVRCSLDKFLLL